MQNTDDCVFQEILDRGREQRRIELANLKHVYSFRDVSASLEQDIIQTEHAIYDRRSTGTQYMLSPFLPVQYVVNAGIRHEFRERLWVASVKVDRK